MTKAIGSIILLWALAAAAPAQTLHLTSPNGGEKWPAGAVRHVTWQATGLGGTVELILRRAGARVGVIAANLPAAQGGFDWIVGRLQEGQAAPGGGYSVRVRSADNQYGDQSDAAFEIFQFTASEPGHPGLRPGQNPAVDGARLSGLPDLALEDVRYYYIDNQLNFDVANRGLAAYSGTLQVRMEVEGGGCHDQTLTIDVPRLEPGQKLPRRGFSCDFFPDPCCHRFRVILVPGRADDPPGNNVFDRIVYRYVGPGSFRLGTSPVRLRFSHGAKYPPCGIYVYSENNTIFRRDIANDYGPGGQTAEVLLEVPVRNCSGQNSYGNMRLTIEHRRSGTVRTTLYHGLLSPADFLISSGQERLIAHALSLPIQPGDYFITIANQVDPGAWECQIALRFASEFFD